MSQDGTVHELVAGPGDAVSIPSGVPHAFAVTGADSARYLIAGAPAGIDAFFADAGEPVERAELPGKPPAFDRERLRAAFAAHGLTPHSFPADGVELAP